MNVAVIPARGGSKRILRKNIRDFMGKPIISYSIKKALLSELFDKVIVSTDDEEINSIAKQFGAECPFIRPSKLSNDYAGTMEVVAHTIQWLENQGFALNSVCCIYPTATKYVYPVERSFKILDNSGLTMLLPENINKRSQDLSPTYHDAGQFYWGNPEAWVENRPIFSERSTIIKLPDYRVADIDTEEDWKRAELMYKILEEEE